MKKSTYRWGRTLALCLSLSLLLSLLPAATSSAATVPGNPWAWGKNTYGQLGNGTFTDSGPAIQVSNLTGVIAVSAGYYHNLALKSDGTVWAWGYNGSTLSGYFGHGMLGNGTNIDSNVPVQTSNLTGVTAIAAGGWHSLALKSDGTVWAWGRNNYGQLGDGTTTESNIPVQVSGLTGVIAIAGGEYHSLALKSTGTVWAWGRNAYGQLGTGNTTDSYIPVQVTGLTGVTAISAGYNFNLALKSDGTVRSWGSNASFTLGTGTEWSGNSSVPVQVNGITGAIAISAGYNHSLALKSDGTVRGWGGDYYGQLGNVSSGPYIDSYDPVQVVGFTGAAAIAAGYSYSLAVKSDGTVWGWGYNGFGLYGGITPTRLNSLSGVTAIATGSMHGLAIRKPQLMVSASSASRDYGAANPSFSGTITGIQGGDPITATYSTTATTTSTAGTYAIVPAVSDGGSGKLANYDVILTNGTLTVDKVPLTVTASGAAKVYGAALPSFSATYSGFVLGQDQSVLGGTLAFSTTATSTSNVGTYPITPSGLTSSNYTITFQSGTLTITKAPLTVTADGQTKTYGAANPTLTAHGTGLVGADTLASLSLGYTLDTTATTTSPVDSYPITITGGAGSTANYSPITYSGSTLTVNKAPLTVTANGASKVYGAALPSFSATYSGFVLGQDQSVLGGTLALSTTATTTSDAGTYPITPGGLASSNYAITFQDGTLTVTKAPLTVTANGADKVYGASLPSFSASYSGFVLEQDQSVLGGTLAFSTTATLTSNVGTYPITPSGLTSSNYAITFQDGTLTVTKAPLTVTANNADKVYGAALPSFSATYSGFVLGQDQSVLGGTLALSTTATTTSDAGTYPITPGGLASSNYAITFQDGTLTVTKAPLTVTANGADKVYGAALPSFSATYSGFVLGQDQGVLGGTLAFSTTATSTSNVGTYPITPGGLTSSNYAITFQDGTLTITKADTTTTVASSLNPSVRGQSVILSATVTAVSPGSGVPSGNVSFKSGDMVFPDGGATLGTVALNGSGQATYTTSALNIATHNITAVYDGDTNFDGSSSSALSQVVVGATMTLTVTLEGDGRPEAGMDVPLTLKLYDTEVTTANILTLSPVEVFSTESGAIAITSKDIVNAKVVVTATVGGLAVGNYYITLYSPHCLVNYKTGVTIAPSGTAIDMGKLLEGDAKDISESSKAIDSTDFNRFALAYEAVPTSGNWNALADFDRSQLIDIYDFNLLYDNYGKSSPQVV